MHSEKLALAVSAAWEDRERVEADPLRPEYHFRAPSRWMNDPCAPFFHQGWYHLFYQLNPFGDNHARMHWGHARSRDLVDWEHLPVALAPSEEKGEAQVYSGGAWPGPGGKPLLFYTAVMREGPFQQWMAEPEDSDLMHWRKSPANPLLSLENQARFADDWRDPWLFASGDAVWMIVGCAGDKKGLPLFRALNPELTRWAYHGLLADTVETFECPAFFSLGQHWVLIASRWMGVDYEVGRLDQNRMRFTPEKIGFVDAHYNRRSQDWNGLYAATVLRREDAPPVLLGWMRGFPAGQGWCGCLSLPHELSLDADLSLRQRPLPALAQLRADHFPETALSLDGPAQVWLPAEGERLELSLRLELEPGCQGSLELRCAENVPGASLEWSPGLVQFAGARVELRDPAVRTLDLHVFLDGSLLEVFINDGEACLARIFQPQEKALRTRLNVKSGSVQVLQAQAWTLRPARFSRWEAGN